MHKIITYGSFVIASLVVIVAFMTATTYIQLVVAAAFYPLLAYFAYKVLPDNWRYASKKPVTNRVQPPVESAEKVEIEKTKKERTVIDDIDKRAFLKLIGGTGFSIFLFSLINKKVGSLFPGGNVTASETTALIKDPSGNIIHPAQKKPLDDYNISDIENSATTYYGFVSKDGSWYIMRVDTNTGTFRYTKEKSNFRANWANRANLKYDYFDNVFR